MPPFTQARLPYEIVEKKVTVHARVSSQTDPLKKYDVVYDEEKKAWACTCPSYQNRGSAACKHIFAVKQGENL